MFPGQSQPKDKGKPKSKPQGPGAQQDMHNPPPMRPSGPKPGQGMDPMEAMLGGMGDMGQFAPPAPGAPMGPGGMPVGGGMPSSDPGMDPQMGGSSLFQALNMGLEGGGGDPFASPPMGHGQLDPPPDDINTLLGMLALMQSGAGGMGGPQQGLNPSGVMPAPTSPGQTMGLNPFQVTQ